MMRVLVVHDPADERVHLLTPGIAALGAEVQVGGFAPQPIPGTGGVIILDDGSEAALSAVVAHAGAEPAGSTTVVVLLRAASPQRRGRLLAAGAARVLDGQVSGERLASELQALAETASSGPDRLRSELLQPFIAATIEAWSVMADVSVRTTAIQRKTDFKMAGDLSALIHLVGTNERLLVLSMSAEVARELAIAMLHRLVLAPTDEMICDSAGEMINIIAGQVKGSFVGTPYEFDIGLPIIVSGTNHEIKHRSELPCFIMVFTSPFGPFTVQLCVRTRESHL